MSSIPAVKTTTRPTSAGRNFVALSFLVNGHYFKDDHKILGTLGLDYVSFTQWIHIVEWIAPFVKRNADWSVQKARTEAVRRGEKNPVRLLLSDSGPLQLRRYLPSTMGRLAKIILRTLRTNVSCLSSAQGPVVRRLDNAIHRINHYPVDRCWQNKPRYPLDSDLSGG